MARKAGLKRGLRDIPSDKESAASVLSHLGRKEVAPDSTDVEEQPEARVEDPETSELDSAPIPEPSTSRNGDGSPGSPSGRSRPRRPRKKAASSSRPRRPARRPRSPRSEPDAAPDAAPDPSAHTAEPQEPERPHRPSDRDIEQVRSFYGKVGQEVTRMFDSTLRQVLSSGRGLEEVIPQAFSKLIRGFGKLSGSWQDQLARLWQNQLSSDLLDPATWEGLFYLVKSSYEMKLETRRRRKKGDYEVDEFGLDEDFLFSVQPLARFLYDKWFRVTATGLENVPHHGRTLFVANHSGVLPYDGGMIATAVWDHHPSPRLVRALHLEWFVSVPFIAPFLQRTGQVLANPENGERLLKKDHLVTVFPEGLKGVGKHFKDRYQLARFGRGGFIKMAIRANSPIIPVSVVGGEEIHPVLAQLDFIARPLGLPFAPMTPTFPWLGPLGLIPLPSKWCIHFGEPIDMADYAPEDASDFHLVSQLTDHVRMEIQRTIYDLLRQRGGAFV